MAGGNETIGSVREYVLASQKAPRLEVFTRQSDQCWVRRVYGPGQRAVLAAIDCEIGVDAVYADAVPAERGTAG